MGELKAGDDGAESQSPHRRIDGTGELWLRRYSVACAKYEYGVLRKKYSSSSPGLVENWSCGRLVVPGSSAWAWRELTRSSAKVQLVPGPRG